MLDELAKEGVSGAPAWIEGLATVLGLAAAAFWARIQIRKGRTDAATPQQAELAMVALDSEALKQVAAGLEAINLTMVEANAIARADLEDRRKARDEAELEAARREGYERGLAAPRPRRRAPARKARAG